MISIYIYMRLWTTLMVILSPSCFPAVRSIRSGSIRASPRSAVPLRSESPGLSQRRVARDSAGAAEEHRGPGAARRAGPEPTLGGATPGHQDSYGWNDSNNYGSMEYRWIMMDIANLSCVVSYGFICGGCEATRGWASSRCSNFDCPISPRLFLWFLVSSQCWTIYFRLSGPGIWSFLDDWMATLRRSSGTLWWLDAISVLLSWNSCWKEKRMVWCKYTYMYIIYIYRYINI